MIVIPCVNIACVCAQASTLDGVLEIKNEHFWTIAYGSFVSERRLRYDAANKFVLSHIRLAPSMYE